MASSCNLCGPCADESKSLEATRYCLECEENLCDNCAYSHVRFKAFKSHHVVDLAAIGSRKPPLKKNCKNHADAPVDFYCVKHQNCFCGACIPLYHRICDTVIPLETAARNVKTSPLFVDTLREHDNIIKTLEQFLKDRENSQNEIEKKESSIFFKIMDVKTRLIDHINVLELNLKEELSTINAKSSAKIAKEKEEILNLLTTIKESKEELKFLKDHCSDSQIFLELQQNVLSTSKIGSQIVKMITNIGDIDIEFKETTILFESMGSISETTHPCKVQYRPMQAVQAQVSSKQLQGFVKFGQLTLKSGIDCNITDIVITPDHKLILCNYWNDLPKVYSYTGVGYKDFDKEITFQNPPYGIAVLPDTDRAVVTSPGDQIIHFVSTTSMTTSRSLNIRINCYGVTASNDKLFVGSTDVIQVLKHDGTLVANIKTSNTKLICSMFYRKDLNQLLYRSTEGLFAVENNDKFNQICQVDGESGLAVDHQGYIYLSQRGLNEIQRLNPECKPHDVVLTKAKGINKPYCITFNKDYTKLFVVNRCQSVVIFTCNH